MLLTLLEHTATGRVLVFTRTKHRAKRLARDLESRRYRVAALQGNMAQARRQEALDGFRDGKYDILVATDIASRGIDVYQISHVINYDMPMTVDAYTHRIGRAGRAHATGDAITLMVPDDESMVRRIERVLRSNIPRRRLADFDYGGFSPITQSTDSRDHRGNGRASAGAGDRRYGSSTRGPRHTDARPQSSSGGRPGGRPGYRTAPTGARQDGGARRRRTNRRPGPSPSNGRAQA
jgi:ATP-dependent RNA helicase RhlE